LITRRPDATCWWCQYKTQAREHLFKNCPQWKSQQKTLWTTVLEETRKLTGPARGRDRTRSRSCSPTSGAARRSWTFSQQQTSAGRQAQRWQQTKTARPVRPRNGIRGNRRSGRRSAWQRRNGLGRRLKGISFFFTIFKFLYFLCSQLPVRLARQGG